MKKFAKSFLLILSLVTMCFIVCFGALACPLLNRDIYIDEDRPDIVYKSEGYFTYKYYESSDATKTCAISKVDKSVSGNVVIPDTFGEYVVFGIADDSFKDCSKIESVVIPDSVRLISSYAFRNCTGLKTVRIPEKVSSIGAFAFENCTGLKSIIVDENNESYSSDSRGVLFDKAKTQLMQYPAGNEETYYEIPDSVVSINAKAFVNCSNLKNITISENVRTILFLAFENCSGIESLIVPDGVTTITDGAFMNCSSLKNVTISKSVTSIGESVFRGCVALQNITVDKNNADYSSDGNGVLFNKDKTKLIQYNVASTRTTYEIPDSVERVECSAFENSENLEEIRMPDSVNFIGCSLYDHKFNNCTSLKRIIVDENNDVFSSDDNGVLFDKEKTTLIIYPSASMSTSYIIPETVSGIYSNAFENNKNLEDIYYLGNKNNSIKVENATLHYCDKVETDATCTEAGVIKYVCTECSGYKVVKTVQASLGHNMGSYVVTTKPTCTSSGVERSDCTRCDYFVTRTVTSIAHSYTAKVTEPTCTAAGYTTYTCSCGDSYVANSVSSLGHSFSAYKTDNNATCTADGTKTAKCDRCTATKTVTDTGSALGHNMGSYVVVTKPTTTTEGVERSDCSRCDYYVTRAVPVEVNIYNLGEETYSFNNFGDSDSANGHCFGMSITSSGYYIGSLDKSIIGVNDNTALYSLSKTNKVKAPICYYHKIQGPGPERQSMVAGGSIDLKSVVNIKADWSACVNYVKSHKYDNKGSLQIGMWFKEGGGHAVNFLYYAKVNGQDRIYAYDNNFPTTETYYYMGTDGYIRQYVPGYIISYSIIGLNLTDAKSYFELAEEFKSGRYIYANKDEIVVENATVYDMKCSENSEINAMFEIPEGSTMVKIIPLVDNAKFEYLEADYSFGGVNEDTYGKLSLTKSGDSASSFEIIAGDDCTCNCHKTGLFSFIWKIINFFNKLLKTNKECACGKMHY